MALANRVFTSRVTEYQNSTIADHNYENDNTQMFPMNATPNYQDLQTVSIHPYQKLASTSQTEFANGSLNEGDQGLSSGVVRLSLQEEPQPRISHDYDQVPATEDETTEQQRSYPRQFCDPRYCRRGKKVLLITFFAMLLFMLSVLVILFIIRNIGPQLEENVMMQGELTFCFHANFRYFL